MFNIHGKKCFFATMHLRIFLQTSVVIFLIIPCFSSGTNRFIKCAVYSDLKDSENLNLVHIIATGDQDVIHYLWSTRNLPSVIVSTTTKDTNLKIDFEKLRMFQYGAFTFSKEPIASTGFVITELWKNSYDSDTSEVDDMSSVVPLNLESFQWKNVMNSSIRCSDQFALLNFVSSSDNVEFSKKGTFEVQFSVSGREESASEYPHLIYTGNSTQIRIVLNNLYSNSTRVRYGIELSVLAPLSKKCSLEQFNDCKTVITKSMSDEFSPGIFSDIELLPPCSHDSFLSWRPVSYTSDKPSVANSTDVKITSKCSKSVIGSHHGIAELFFGDQANVSVSALNVTFGTKGDGFYPKTEYTAWSLMAGVGTSVGFKLSVTAIIILSIGMGALILFILCGVVFIIVQKCRKKDDELLLNSVN